MLPFSQQDVGTLAHSESSSMQANNEDPVPEQDPDMGLMTHREPASDRDFIDLTLSD